eukprot:Nk52_evm11s2449 gene=Nk52_evmTU11s2449
MSSCAPSDAAPPDTGKGNALEEGEARENKKPNNNNTTGRRREEVRDQEKGGVGKTYSMEHHPPPPHKEEEEGDVELGVRFVVGKNEPTGTVLFTEDHNYVEFPTPLLPGGITEGSIVSFRVVRQCGVEKQRKKDFIELQQQIFELAEEDYLRKGIQTSSSGDDVTEILPSSLFLTGMKCDLAAVIKRYHIKLLLEISHEDSYFGASVQEAATAKATVCSSSTSVEQQQGMRSKEQGGERGQHQREREAEAIRQQQLLSSGSSGVIVTRELQRLSVSHGKDCIDNDNDNTAAVGDEESLPPPLSSPLINDEEGGDGGVADMDVEDKTKLGILNSLFAHKHIRIANNKDADISQFFEEAYQFIRDGHMNQRAVLVLGEEGISASASFVLSYLMQQKQMSLREAFDHVHRGRPGLAPSFGYMSQLQTLEWGLSRSGVKESSFLAHYVKDTMQGWEVEVEDLRKTLERFDNNVNDSIDFLCRPTK